MSKLNNLKKQYEKLGKEIEKLEREEGKIQLHDLVKWSEYEWYVIGTKDNKYTLFLKDKMPKDLVERLFDSKFLDSDSDVRFNTNCENIWWKDSHIRMALNSEYLKYLNLDEMIRMKTTVNIDNEESTTEDYVRLITKEEVEKLPEEILRCGGEYGYWTMTPSLFIVDSSAREFSVNSTGTLSGNSVSYGCGVRPVVQVSDVNKLTKLEK